MKNEEQTADQLLEQSLIINDDFALIISEQQNDVSESMSDILARQRQKENPIRI